MHVDLTESNPENEKIAQDYGVVSLPTILIAGPGGQICQASSLFGFEEAASFAERLKKAKAACSH